MKFLINLFKLAFYPCERRIHWRSNRTGFKGNGPSMPIETAKENADEANRNISHGGVVSYWVDWQSK